MWSFWTCMIFTLFYIGFASSPKQKKNECFFLLKMSSVDHGFDCITDHGSIQIFRALFFVGCLNFCFNSDRIFYSTMGQSCIEMISVVYLSGCIVKKVYRMSMTSQANEAMKKERKKTESDNVEFIVLRHEKCSRFIIKMPTRATSISVSLGFIFFK